MILLGLHRQLGHSGVLHKLHLSGVAFDLHHPASLVEKENDILHSTTPKNLAYKFRGGVLVILYDRELLSTFNPMLNFFSGLLVPSQCEQNNDSPILEDEVWSGSSPVLEKRVSDQCLGVPGGVTDAVDSQSSRELLGSQSR